MRAWLRANTWLRILSILVNLSELNCRYAWHYILQYKEDFTACTTLEQNICTCLVGAKCIFVFQLNNYLQTSWSGQFEVNPLDSEEFKVVTMEDQEARDDDSSDGQPIKHLSLSVHTKQDGVKHGGGSRDVYIYSKYWLINKTGLPLQIRVSF